jgi:hypothetical protein
MYDVKICLIMNFRANNQKISYTHLFPWRYITYYDELHFRFLARRIFRGTREDGDGVRIARVID